MKIANSRLDTCTQKRALGKTHILHGTGCGAHNHGVKTAFFLHGAFAKNVQGQLSFLVLGDFLHEMLHVDAAT